MAKQTGYIKATGTVDGDTNFYYDQLWGYLVRMCFSLNMLYKEVCSL
jgi:hypothetical protein